MPERPDPEMQGDGDRRGDDRRGADRRRPERRAPPPPWRRPWAYAGYGVAAAFAVVILLRMVDEDEPDDLVPQTVTATPAVDSTAPRAPSGPPREALGTGEFERLLAQGGDATGQRVVTVLDCEEVQSIALVDDDNGVHASIAALADANSRVPGAECRWGDEPSAPDLLLLVPPSLAPDLAAAPEVQQSFVRRRRIRAEIEWIGRSEDLALRNVGVLTAIQ